MSSTRLRLVAIGCGVLAIAIRIGFLAELVMWGPSAAWLIGSYLAAAVIPIAIWTAVAWPTIRRLRPFRIDAGKRRFTVGGRVILQPMGIMMFGLGVPVIPVQRVPGTDHGRVDIIPGLLPIMVVVLIGSMLGGLALILLDRPRLWLDAGGLTLVRPLSRQRVEWDAIVPGTTMFHASGPRVIMWNCAPGTPPPSSMSIAALGIDPVFLLHSVRVYADLPERRTEIGTQAGLDRLLTERLSRAAGMQTAPATA